jgi:hypothetical protein
MMRQFVFPKDETVVVMMNKIPTDDGITLDRDYAATA